MLNKIKSKYILDFIFQNVKNKLKLKLIKHNNALLTRLNITKEDFKVYGALKEFNKELNLYFGDIDIEEIDLSKKNIEIERVIHHLNQVKFKELKKLLLNNDFISDIKSLKDLGLTQIETIELSKNKISDINVFENVNMENLLNLNLCENNISEIEVLEKVKFEKLKSLKLRGNKISDIRILEKVNFRELKELYLSKY